MRNLPAWVLVRTIVSITSGGLLLPASAASQSMRQPKQVAQVGSVSITAAIVLADMTVRPLPLLNLDLIRTDRTDTVRIHTDLNGSAVKELAPGAYRIRSTSQVQLEGKSYSWDVPLSISAGAASPVELTNANAAVSAVAVAPARQLAPGRAVFEKVRGGVFRVEAGLGHGSGFLIEDDGGLIVTNEHVVSGTTNASIYLDSATRVPAQVVVRDRDADLALLRIPAGRCSTCPRLPLAHRKAGEPLVVEGESVLAIGVPLHQDITLTTGIASSVRQGAIISDVNLNPGNSGGPMLNLAGEVIGVNAFIDATGRVGPGISGAITIDRLFPLLQKVPSTLATLPPVEDRVLPTMPLSTYPLPLLKAFTDTADYHSYMYFSGRSAGHFQVSLLTPTFLRVLARADEDAVAKDRRKREARAGVEADVRYSELRETHDWEQYVGDETAPVVTIYVEPKLSESFWSRLGRGLQAAQYGRALSAARLKFDGDVRGARFYRNGVEIESLRGGHGPQKVQIDNQWVDLKDVADRGYYVLPPELFAPDSDGAPPMVSIVVQDLKNPGDLSSVDVWGETAARVWNDFAPYYQTVHPERHFRLANPRLQTKVRLTCDPQSGRCDVKSKG